MTDGMRGGPDHYPEQVPPEPPHDTDAAPDQPAERTAGQSDYVESGTGSGQDNPARSGDNQYGGNMGGQEVRSSRDQVRPDSDFALKDPEPGSEHYADADTESSPHTDRTTTDQPDSGEQHLDGEDPEDDADVADAERASDKSDSSDQEPVAPDGTGSIDNDNHDNNTEGHDSPDNNDSPDADNRESESERADREQAEREQLERDRELAEKTLWMSKLDLGRAAVDETIAAAKTVASKLGSLARKEADALRDIKERISDHYDNKYRDQQMNSKVHPGHVPMDQKASDKVHELWDQHSGSREFVTSYIVNGVLKPITDKGIPLDQRERDEIARGAVKEAFQEGRAARRLESIAKGRLQKEDMSTKHPLLHPIKLYNWYHRSNTGWQHKHGSTYTQIRFPGLQAPSSRARPGNVRPLNRHQDPDRPGQWGRPTRHQRRGLGQGRRGRK